MIQPRNRKVATETQTIETEQMTEWQRLECVFAPHGARGWSDVQDVRKSPNSKRIIEKPV